MAYSQTAAPIPPPPSMGGNRANQHVVGNKTSNMGYAAGSNLQNARTLYQKGAQGTTFRNQAPVRPRFGYQPTNSGQALPNAGQAAGNQMRANTIGQVRPANAPAGMGYQNIAQGPVRQYTTPGSTGQEALGAHLTYTPLPPPPSTPTKPAGAVKTPVAGTGTTKPSSTTIPKSGINPTVGPQADPNNPTGLGNITTSNPVYRSVSQAIRESAAGWKVGNQIRNPKDGKVYEVVDGMSIDGVYMPIIRTAAGGTSVHPAWLPLIGDGLMNNYPVNIPKASATAPKTPAPSPTIAAPPPPPPAPTGSNVAAAPKPTVTGAQAVRQRYSGQLNKGVRVYGSDGMQRIVQYMGKSPSGGYVPWVNKPGGGYMIHPDWQGI